MNDKFMVPLDKQWGNDKIRHETRFTFPSINTSILIEKKGGGGLVLW